MSKVTMTLKQWRRSLGEAVSLEDVPAELGISPREVGGAVRAGQLKVQTFRALNGPTIRMVRRRDLRLLQMTLRPPSIRDFIRAFQQIMDQPPKGPTRAA